MGKVNAYFILAISFFVRVHRNILFQENVAYLGSGKIYPITWKSQGISSSCFARHPACTYYDCNYGNDLAWKPCT